VLNYVSCHGTVWLPNDYSLDFVINLLLDLIAIDHTSSKQI